VQAVSRCSVLYLESTDLQHPAYVSNHAPLAALQAASHVHCSITVSTSSSSTFRACRCQGTVLVPLRMLVQQVVVLLLAAVLVC
jgi:hypothetical protein